MESARARGICKVGGERKIVISAETSESAWTTCGWDVYQVLRCREKRKLVPVQSLITLINGCSISIERDRSAIYFAVNNDDV